MGAITTATIATVTVFLVQYVVKKYGTKVPLLNRVPLFVLVAATAFMITFVGHSLLNWMPDKELGALAFESVIAALASSGLYDLSKKGSLKPLKDFDKSQDDT